MPEEAELCRKYDFEGLKKRHERIHKSYFERVKIHIASGEESDTGLYEHLFQYGRYLMICSSRPADEMIQPETVSIEISDPVTADIAYTIDPLSPAESEAIDMASTENDEIVIEDIEYPDEGDIFQSDMQDVMDWVAGETMDIPLLDNAIYSDDTIVEDSQLFSI